MENPLDHDLNSLFRRQTVSHQSLELFLVDTPDSSLMRDFSERVGHTDNGDCAGHSTIFDNFHTVDMAPGSFRVSGCHAPYGHGGLPQPLVPSST